MSTETDVPSDTATEQATVLAAPFVVEASGPVHRRQRVDAGIVETVETTVEIQREITTAEEFDRWHKLHQSMQPLADAIGFLLDDRDGYHVTEEDRESWQLLVDGPVAAYQSAAETFADHDEIRYTDYTSLTHQCSRCHLFGVGARIAELDARRAVGDSIDSYLRQFAEERDL